MRWIVSLSVVLMACGGPQIPTHNGYKPKEAKPWKKPKLLKFDDKLEVKSDGELSYADLRRARWFQIETPANGQLALTLEITPPGDTVNDDFDLGFEIFDPSQRVIGKSDLEDSDAHELIKKKTLIDLVPGKYLVHVYLQGRMDSADFVLRGAFKPTTAAEAKSNFPAEVPFLPTLPTVPIQDDTPRGYKQPTAVVTTTSRGSRRTPEPKVTAPPPVATLNGRIIGVQVVGAGTVITVGVGKGQGASEGMKGRIKGISGGFTLASCGDRTCSATVSATLDQINRSDGTVTLSP
jgi:hypothetical protein